MEAFDWHRLLIDQYPYAFLLEVLMRTALSFLLVVVTLRIMGRSSVDQLSLLDVVVILTLGSIAGDMNFYEDIPLLVALVVFVTVLALYRLTTFLARKSRWFKHLVEGTTYTVVENGRFTADQIAHYNDSRDAVMMKMRLHNVEHLGQVRLGIMEVSDQLSLFYYADDEVKPGLSILVGVDHEVRANAVEKGIYACYQCGLTRELAAGEAAVCADCKAQQWLPALSVKRIS